MLACILPTLRDGYGQVAASKSGRGKFDATFEDDVEFAPEFALAHNGCAGNKGVQLRVGDEVQQVVIRHELLLAKHRLLAQTAEQQRDVPALRQIAENAVQINLPVPG